MQKLNDSKKSRNALSSLILIVMLLFTNCGKEETPKPFPPVQHCPGLPVVEYAGEEYPTVLIGNQCWLAKNLNIGTLVADSSDMLDNGIIEKYCYNSDTAKCTIFGGLYQWDEMMQYASEEGAQGICPEGWRIPTHRDFVELFLYCDNYPCYLINNEDSLWRREFNNAESISLNLTGFSALPAGQTQQEGTFYRGLYEYAGFWSSRQTSDSTSIVFGAFGLNDYKGTNLYKYEGYSVRCIKDE